MLQGKRILALAMCLIMVSTTSSFAMTADYNLPNENGDFWLSNGYEYYLGDNEIGDYNGYDYVVGEDEYSEIEKEIVPFAPTAGFTTTPMVSAGAVHTVALASDGTVWAWGANSSGMLGDGTTVRRTTPVQVRGLNNIISVSAGQSHSLALRSDGTVWAWGLNGNGQLGNGTTTSSSTPVQVQGIMDVAEISAGASHSLALRQDGTVWTWGRNNRGQLGIGTNSNSSVPLQVHNLTNIVAISAGASHSLALRQDGFVWEWGLGLERNALGTIVIRDRLTPNQVSISNVMAIATTGPIPGGRVSMVLLQDGTVWTWGMSQYRVFGDETGTSRYIPARIAELSNIQKIFMGDSDAFALGQNNEVWAWGTNDHGQFANGTTTPRPVPTRVNGLGDIADIAIGGSFTLILRPDGTVWASGANNSGQLGDGTTVTRRTNLVQVLGPGGVGYLNLFGDDTPPPPRTITINVEENGHVNISPAMSWGRNDYVDGRIRISFSWLDRENYTVRVNLPNVGWKYTTEINMSGLVPMKEVIITPAPQDCYLGRFFRHDSDEFNRELGKLAAELSILAYDGYDYLEVNLFQKLWQLGFENIAHSAPDTQSPDHHRVGFTVAHSRNIIVNGESRTVIFIVIRGTDGNDEWHSNFDMGLGTVHAGFEQAMRYVLYGASSSNQLDSYIRQHKLYETKDSNIVFITGHSRGAAVSNLLGAAFNRHQYPNMVLNTPHFVMSENLYVYTFATPNTTRQPDRYHHNRNIFNFVNAEDFVTYMPLVMPGWYYQRHGRTYAFPSRGIYGHINQQIAEAIRQDAYQKHRSLTGRRLTARGVVPVMGIIHHMHTNVAPSVYAYYNYQHGAHTPRQFFNIVAGAATQDVGSVARLLAIAYPLGPLSITVYTPVARFLAEEAILHALHGHHVPFSRGSPHCPVKYLAWMEAITGYGDLISEASLPMEGNIRRVRIGSPVDVSVYNNNDQLVGRIISKVVDDTVEQDNILAFVLYDVKYIYLPIDEGYTLRFVGNDTGTMIYSVEDFRFITSQLIEQREFVSVELYDDRELRSIFGENASDTRLLIIENDIPVGEILEDGTEVIFGLTELTIPGVTLSPAFCPSIFNYTANVANSVSSITINAEVNDGVTVVGTGTHNLSVGQNTITITVTNAAGDVQTYTIVITREAGQGGNNLGGGGGVQQQPQLPEPEVPLDEYSDAETLPFGDVRDSDWFYDAVRYVFENNVMQGISDNAFAPNNNFSRAMVAATLYRMVHGGTSAEVPYVRNRQIFDDVSTNSWFSHYIAWAYDYGIVIGISDELFAPNDDVTREQLATILHRFARFREYDSDVREGNQWNNFTDRNQISALEEMQNALMWANYHEFITGRTVTTIVPRGTTTRAEAATILKRFMQWAAE